jgi:hypothetical protein
MSQLARISGPLLTNNLLRNGVDLAFETSLLYLDVADNRIGINTAGPTRDLTIVGTTNIANDLIATSKAKVANIVFGPDNNISTITGSLFLSATTITSATLATDNLLISNNEIQSIINNSDIIITDANGFNIYSNTVNHGDMEVTGNILIDTNLHVFGNLNLGSNSQATDDITFSGELGNDLFPTRNNYYQLGYHNEKWKDVYLGTAAISSNIIIDSTGLINTITSNSSLTLSGMSGNVIVESLQFNNNIIASTATNSTITITPGSGASAVISSTSAMQIPVGSETDRPSMSSADIRYSTTDGRYRGYGTSNITFGGVFSDDRLTYVTPESTLNANDKVINFTINGISAATIDTNRATVNSAQISKISITSDTISTTTTNSNLYLSPAGAGSVVINNISIKGSTINSNNGLTLSSTNNGYINFNTTVGMRIPAGGNSVRPLSPVQGLTRYNTDLGYLEIYTGSDWEPAYGASPFITASQMQDLTLIHSLLLGS